MKNRVQKFLGFLLVCVVMTGVFAFGSFAAEGETTIDNAITYEGLSARIKGDGAGIRSVWSVDNAFVEDLVAGGSEVRYGVIMGLAEYNGQSYSDPLTVAKNGATISAGRGNSSVAVVYDSTGKYTGVYVSKTAERSTFAYTTVYSGYHETVAHLSDLKMTYRAFLIVDDQEPVYYDMETAETSTFGAAASAEQVYAHFSASDTYAEIDASAKAVFARIVNICAAEERPATVKNDSIAFLQSGATYTVTLPDGASIEGATDNGDGTWNVTVPSGASSVPVVGLNGGDVSYKLAEDVQIDLGEGYYTVTFKDASGKVISTQTIKEGEFPIVPTVVSSLNGYAHTGWRVEGYYTESTPEDNPVTGETTYVAMYDDGGVHAFGGWTIVGGVYENRCPYCGEGSTLSASYAARESVEDANYAEYDIVVNDPQIAGTTTMNVNAAASGWYSVVPTVTEMPSTVVYMRIWGVLGGTNSSYNLIRPANGGADAITVYLTEGSNTVNIRFLANDASGSTPSSLPGISSFTFHLVHKGENVANVDLQDANRTTAADYESALALQAEGKDVFVGGSFRSGNFAYQAPVANTQILLYGKKLTVSEDGLYHVATLAGMFPNAGAVLVLTDADGADVARFVLNADNFGEFSNAGVYGTDGTIVGDYANLFIRAGAAALKAGEYTVRVASTSETWMAGSVMLLPADHACVYDGESYEAKVPTCGETGLNAGHKCSFCGEVNPADILPIDPNAHTGERVWVADKATMKYVRACPGCGADPEYVEVAYNARESADFVTHDKTSVAVSAEGTRYTATFNADVDGMYMIVFKECAAPTTAGYIRLWGSALGGYASSYGYAKADTAFVETDTVLSTYLTAGENTITFDVPAGMTVGKIDARLVYEGSVVSSVAQQGNLTINGSASAATAKENGDQKTAGTGKDSAPFRTDLGAGQVLYYQQRLTVTEAGFYRLGIFGHAYTATATGLVVLDDDVNGGEAVRVAVSAANEANYYQLFGTMSAGFTTNYFDGGLVYLAAGTYNVRATQTTASQTFVIGGVTLMTVEHECVYTGDAYEGYDATCAENGLSAGNACAFCGEINPADVILATGEHDYTNAQWQILNGQYVRLCNNCEGEPIALEPAYDVRTSVDDTDYNAYDVVVTSFSNTSSGTVSMSVTVPTSGWYSLVPTMSALPSTLPAYMRTWGSALGGYASSYNLIRSGTAGDDATSVYLTEGANTVNIRFLNTSGSEIAAPTITQVDFYLIYKGTNYSTINLQDANRTTATEYGEAALLDQASGKDVLVGTGQAWQINGTAYHVPVNAGQIVLYGQKLTVTEDGLYRVASLASAYGGSTAVLIITDAEGNDVARLTADADDVTVHENAGIYGTPGTVNTDFTNVFVDFGGAALTAGSYTVRLASTSGTWVAGSVMLLPSDHVCVFDGELHDAKAPNCTENGYTEGLSCSICGGVNPADEIPANGQHAFTEWKLDATGNVQTLICVGCGMEGETLSPYYVARTSVNDASYTPYDITVTPATEDNITYTMTVNASVAGWYSVVPNITVQPTAVSYLRVWGSALGGEVSSYNTVRNNGNVDSGSVYLAEGANTVTVRLLTTGGAQSNTFTVDSVTLYLAYEGNIHDTITLQTENRTDSTKNTLDEAKADGKDYLVVGNQGYQPAELGFQLPMAAGQVMYYGQKLTVTKDSYYRLGGLMNAYGGSAAVVVITNAAGTDVVRVNVSASNYASFINAGIYGSGTAAFSGDFASLYMDLGAVQLDAGEYTVRVAPTSGTWVTAAVTLTEIAWKHTCVYDGESYGAIKATCGTDGRNAGNKCSICGEMNPADVIPATGVHVLTDWAFDAEEQVYSRSCSDCGEAEVLDTSFVARASASDASYSAYDKTVTPAFLENSTTRYSFTVNADVAGMYAVVLNDCVAPTAAGYVRMWGSLGGFVSSYAYAKAGDAFVAADMVLSVYLAAGDNTVTFDVPAGMTVATVSVNLVYEGTHVANVALQGNLTVNASASAATSKENARDEKNTGSGKDSTAPYRTDLAAGTVLYYQQRLTVAEAGLYRLGIFGHAYTATATGLVVIDDDANGGEVARVAVSAANEANFYQLFGTMTAGFTTNYFDCGLVYLPVGTYNVRVTNTTASSTFVVGAVTLLTPSHTCVFDGESYEGYDATCTTAGLRAGNACSFCGATNPADILPTNATHNYGGWEIVGGKYVRTCADCGEGEETLGSSYVARTSVEDANYASFDRTVTPTTSDDGINYSMSVNAGVSGWYMVVPTVTSEPSATTYLRVWGSALGGEYSSYNTIRVGAGVTDALSVYLNEGANTVSMRLLQTSGATATSGIGISDVTVYLAQKGTQVSAIRPQAEKASGDGSDAATQQATGKDYLVTGAQGALAHGLVYEQPIGNGQVFYYGQKFTVNAAGMYRLTGFHNSVGGGSATIVINNAETKAEVARISVSTENYASFMNAGIAGSGVSAVSGDFAAILMDFGDIALEAGSYNVRISASGTWIAGSMALSTVAHTCAYDGESYAAKAPTCNETGNRAGNACSVCGQMNPADLLPADSSAHTYAEWKLDGTGNAFVRTCSLCGTDSESFAPYYVARTSTSDENYVGSDITVTPSTTDNQTYTMTVNASVAGWYSVVPNITTQPSTTAYLRVWGSALGGYASSYNTVRPTAGQVDSASVYLSEGTNTVWVRLLNTSGTQNLTFAIDSATFYLAYAGENAGLIRLQDANRASGAAGDADATQKAGTDYLTTGAQGYQPNQLTYQVPLGAGQVFYYGQTFTVSESGFFRLGGLMNSVGGTATIVINSATTNAEVARFSLSTSNYQSFINAGIYGSGISAFSSDFATLYMDFGAIKLDADQYKIRIAAAGGTWVTGALTLTAIETHKHVYDGESYDAVAPTCTSTGLKAGVACSVCGEVNPTDVLPAIPSAHSFTGESYAGVDATCTETGLKAGNKCAHCGIINPDDVLPVVAHNHGDWVLDAASKEYTSICTGCGDVQSMAPAYSYRTTLANNNYAPYDRTGIVPTLSGTRYSASVNAGIAGVYVVQLNITSIPTANGYVRLWGNALGGTHSTYNHVRTGTAYVASNNVLTVYLAKGTNTVSFDVPSGMVVSSVDFRLASAGTSVASLNFKGNALTVSESAADVAAGGTDAKTAGEAYPGSSLAYRTDLPAGATLYFANTLTVSEAGVYRFGAYGHAYTADSRAVVRLTNKTTGNVVSVPLSQDNEDAFALGYGGMDGYSANYVDGGLISLEAGSYSVSVTAVGGIWVAGGVVLTDVSRTNFYDDGTGTVGTATVYVNANAAESGNGSVSAPYASVQDGYNAAVALINSGSVNDVTVSLADGTYVLSETLAIDGADLTRAGNISLVAENAGKATVTSEISVNGADFTNEGNGVYSYALPGTEFRDASLNGTRLTLPTSANDGFFALDSIYYASQAGLSQSDQLLYLRPAVFNGIEKDAQGYFLDSEGNRTTVEVWFIVQWKLYVLRADYMSSTSSSYSDPYYHDALVPVHIISEDWNQMLSSKYYTADSISHSQYWVANNKALLTKNGTFYYDAAAGKVYVKTDADMSKATFSYATLENLVSLTNIDNVTISGINFEGTTMNDVTENGYISGQAGRSMRMINGEYEGYLPYAAIYGENVSNISVTNCTFDEVGYDAVYFHGAVKNVAVADSTFLSVGGTAVRIGEATDAYTSANYAKNVDIVNNYIDGTGILYYLCPAIAVASVENLNIVSNTILNSNYSAIHVGYSWTSYKLSGFPYAEDSFVHVKNAKISENYIQDFMVRLSDGGAIYVVGGNAAGTNEAMLNEISNNYIVATAKTGSGYKHGPSIRSVTYFFLYHDGGSSNWLDKDNVLVKSDDATAPLSYVYYQLSTGGPSTNCTTESAYIVSEDMSSITSVVETTSFSSNRQSQFTATQDNATGAYTLVDGAYTTISGVETNIVRTGIYAYTAFETASASAAEAMTAVYNGAGSDLAAKPLAYGER